MKIMLHALTTTVLVLVSVATVVAQAKVKSNSISPITFAEAEKNQAAKLHRYPDAVYSFNVGKFSYTVTGRGLLSVRSLKAQTILAEVPLDFPAPAFISGIRYLIFKRDLILNYEVTLIDRPIHDGDKVVEGEVLQGRVARFKAKTLKTIWVSISARTDPGTPIVGGNSMFVSGTRMIGEIDLDTGTYLWWHDDVLHSEGAKYFAFTVPRIEGDYVFFEEDPVFLRSRTPETIQVKRRTGEIITMSYKPPELQNK
jgi:hypothetical protein